MEGWFSSRSGSEEQQQKTASSSSSNSLLAEWNSYASTQSSQSQSQSQGMIPFDLESAVRSANDTVTGTFSVVSKGVRDIPGNFQSATSSLPSGKALLYFGLLLASGVFFIFIAFTLFLPIMVVMPQKFAICFTLGCGFIIGSFFALKGPKNQLAHMFSKERLPFTLGFICSMFGTLYVSMVRHSYILSVVFSAVQYIKALSVILDLLYQQYPLHGTTIINIRDAISTSCGGWIYVMGGSLMTWFRQSGGRVLSLGYYVISYFPGGSAGLRFLTSSLTSKIMACFGR